MKKGVTFLLFTLFGSIISYGQVGTCDDTELYHILFEKMKLYEKKAAKVEVGYTPDKTIMNSINKMDIFNDAELKQFNNQTKHINYSDCTNLKDNIQLIISENKINENGTYYMYKFSDLFDLSDSKKCIFLSTAIRSTKSKEGKTVGKGIAYIFTNLENKWSLTDKKRVIESY
ncbi:hypothetical protein [Aquimarina pacifica]|uniref:hypothetical protein n=1 Tax=Aquimarina pacifica TaxID=1296415 RepID=UPI00046EF438|nr:hypothetical protein [Aquimarina pacifica]